MVPSYSHHPILSLLTWLRLNIPNHVFQFPTRTKKDISVFVREWLSINVCFTNRKTASLKSKVKRNWTFISIYEVELVFFPLVLCHFVSKQKFNKENLTAGLASSLGYWIYFLLWNREKEAKNRPRISVGSNKILHRNFIDLVSQKSTKYHRNQSSFCVRFSWSFNLIFVISFACRDLS